MRVLPNLDMRIHFRHGGYFRFLQVRYDTEKEPSSAFPVVEQEIES